MKLLVTRRDESTELLDLALPLSISEGRITDAQGVDYFFNSDGTYDGWGKAVSSNAEAQQIMQHALQSKEPPKDKVQ